MDPANDLHILFLRMIVFSHGDPIGLTAKRIRIPLRAGQMSGCQRAVWHERYIHLPADRDQFPLILPIQQIVVILHGNERCPSMISGHHLHIVKLIAVHGRCPDRTDLPGYHQIIQRFHGLLDGRFIVKAMDDIQVQIIRAQTFQRSLDLPVDGTGRKPARIKVDLGGDDHPISCNVLFERPTQIFLTGPFRVAIGRIKEIDAQIQRMPDDVFRLLFIQCPFVHRAGSAKAHAADTELRHFDVRVPQFCIFHIVTYLLAFPAATARCSDQPVPRSSSVQKGCRPLP